MKLNPDCVRDILIVTEEKSTFSKLIFSEAFENSVLLKKYDWETILYHIRQANEAGLLLDTRFFTGGTFAIKDLSPEGHQFLANVREEKNWNKTKKLADKVGSTSLTVLTSIASSVISTAITRHLDL